LTSTYADYKRLLTGDVFDLILCQISIILLDFSSQTQSAPSNSEAERKIQLITRRCKWQKLSEHCQTQAYRYCSSPLQCPPLNDTESDPSNGTKSPVDARKIRSYGLDRQPQHFVAVCRHGCNNYGGELI